MLRRIPVKSQTELRSIWASYSRRLFTQIVKNDRDQSLKRSGDEDQKETTVKPLEPDASQVPAKAQFRNVDTTPKHLLHMSDIDLHDLDPALKQADLEELIKEARSKIKPVIKAMTNEELKSLIMREEDAEGNKKIIINKPRYYGLLEQHGITIEELRKIQDKHYEVDIEFELTRDLYEKQRIVDGYLQEHQEDNQLLNQYYQNTYKQHANNKYMHRIFSLPYTAKDIRLNIRMMCFTTGFATVALSLIHPILPVCLAYDYFLIAKSLQIMNQTCHQILLDATKRHVWLSKLNFLGYESQPKPRRISLQNIRFMGAYENSTITFQNYGLLPSISRLIQAVQERDKNPLQNEIKQQGQFRHFYKFMANNEVYLVSIDHPNLSESIITQELLLDVIKGKQNRVLEFDFSEREKQGKQYFDEKIEEIKEMYEFKNIGLVTERDKLMREYSYFEPNREFSGKQEDQKWKKVDDGTFIDNGYR